jgi:DNA-binding HxlR family transcriptional regulator
MRPTPTLLALSRYRWNIPVTATLHREQGGDFGGLVDRLAVSRDSLTRTLTFLGDRGWVRHRTTREPHYVLTPGGTRIAPPCVEILQVVEATGTADAAFRRWTLPIARALAGWSPRFQELRAMLPDITPRALTLALKEMQRAGLVHRRVVGGYPPSAEYCLTEQAQQLLPPLLQLSPRPSGR